MKLKMVQNVVCAIMLCALSGCGKVVDWGIEVFDQGKDVERPAKAGKSYVRSMTVYDQWTTVGMFDALWLSDEARTAYVDEYALRRAKNQEFKNTLLRRQLEENRHFITFYVLSPYEFPLGESQSDWQLFLKVDGHIYHPIELKTVELEVEYKGMFGRKFTRFKESYIVRFDAKNVEDEFILKPHTKSMELCFRSPIKEISLIWLAHDQPQKQMLMRQEIEEKNETRLDPEVSQGDVVI